MAELYSASTKPLSLYKDRRYSGDWEEREIRLRESRTLYVGNLSFYTREEQIVDLFSRIGEVKRIVMGLDRIRKTPCGFCFVEYFTRADAEKSVNFLSGTKLDERTIRVDYDVGYSAGRQYGRGRSGGQVRDEYRLDYDPGRGGFGKAVGQQTGMSGMDLWGPQHSRQDGPSPPMQGPFRGGYGGRGGPPGRGRGGLGRGRGRGRGRGGRGRGPGFGQPNGDPGYMDQQGNYGRQGGFKRGRYQDDRESFYEGGYPPSHKRQRMDDHRGPGNGGPISGRPRINGPPQGIGAPPGMGGPSGPGGPGIGGPAINAPPRVERGQDPRQRDEDHSKMEVDTEGERRGAGDMDVKNERSGNGDVAHSNV